VAVVVSIARGHDAAHPFKTLLKARHYRRAGRRVLPFRCRRVASQQARGSAPGPPRLVSGTVTRCGGRTSSPCSAQYLDPRDPGGWTYLGASRG
jgi:hypothetical protein